MVTGSDVTEFVDRPPNSCLPWLVVGKSLLVSDPATIIVEATYKPISVFDGFSLKLSDSDTQPAN